MRRPLTEMTMVIAQAITEYGGISILMSVAVSGFDYIADRLSGLDAATWVLVFSGIFVIWLVVGRPH